MMIIRKTVWISFALAPLLVVVWGCLRRPISKVQTYPSGQVTSMPVDLETAYAPVEFRLVMRLLLDAVNLNTPQTVRPEMAMNQPQEGVRRLRRNIAWVKKYLSLPAVSYKNPLSWEQFRRLEESLLPGMIGLDKETEALEQMGGFFRLASPQKLSSRPLFVPHKMRIDFHTLPLDGIAQNKLASLQRFAFDKGKNFLKHGLSGVAIMALKISRLTQASDLNGFRAGILPGFVALERLSDQQLVSLLQNLSAAVQKKFDSTIRNMFQQNVATFQQITDRTLQEMMTFNILYYQLSLPSVVKKDLIIDYMELWQPHNLDSFLRFYYGHAGPQMKKFTQTIARNRVIPQHLSSILIRQEDQALAMPWKFTAQILNSDPNHFNFSTFKAKPLAVGSMAQTHVAQLNGQPVVVRILNPLSDIRLQDDEKFFLKYAKQMNQILLNYPDSVVFAASPRIENFVKDLTLTVKDELDNMNTIRQQKLAYKIYNGKSYKVKEGDFKAKIFVKVPRIYESKPFSFLSVQEKVPGGKIDKLSPPEMRACSKVLTRLWYGESLYRSGFFHGDMHFGNILVDKQANSDTFHINLYLIDYGMSGTITPSQQRNFLSMQLGATLRHASTLADSIWNLSVRTENKINKARLKEVTKEFVRLNPTEVKIGELLAHVINNGIKLPWNFLSYNRGGVGLDQMVGRGYNTQNYRDIQRIQAKLLRSVGIKNLSKSVRSAAHIGLMPFLKRLWKGSGKNRVVIPVNNQTMCTHLY